MTVLEKFIGKNKKVKKWKNIASMRIFTLEAIDLGICFLNVQLFRDVMPLRELRSSHPSQISKYKFQRSHLTKDIFRRKGSGTV